MPDRNPDPPRLSEEQAEAFLALMSKHEKALSMYVTGLVSCSHDVQDILQSGKIVMWRHFHKFELGTNFLAWGRKIMLRQIFDYRKRSKKHKQQLYFDEKVLDLLDQEMSKQQRERQITQREEALDKCLCLLPRKQREILNMRYQEELSIEQISHHQDKTDSAIYQILYRTRKQLLDCVTKRLQSV